MGTTCKAKHLCSLHSVRLLFGRPFRNEFGQHQGNSRASQFVLYSVCHDFFYFSVQFFGFVICIGKYGVFTHLATAATATEIRLPRNMTATSTDCMYYAVLCVGSDAALRYMSMLYAIGDGFMH